MINIKQISIFLLVVIITGCNNPTDIRNEYLKQGINEEDKRKGKELLSKMENAYGGWAEWKKYKYGCFIQEADWYGRKTISHWDTLPQRFEMRCELGSNNSELTLLNGKNKGSKYWIEDGDQKRQQKNKEIELKKNEYHEKMLFKNYWFQFPFRIREAQIISYGGEEELNGQKYNILYATWGSETANKDYDQFVLYLNKSTHKIEKLYFTVREKLNKISLTAEFKDFRNTNGLELPYSQYVRYGKPDDNGIKFHENHYKEVWFE